jgi:signal transduction histidine kinase
MIETQYGLISALRSICEQLYPTGIDDPLGLPGVLRRQIMKVQERWDTGTCQLRVTGSPLPIEPHVQHAALRITKEALANSVKHSGASQAMVHLHYPSAAHELVQLTIQDNGRGDAVITPIPEHWGVLSMQENARAVGGKICFIAAPGKGTRVEFAFLGGHEPRGVEDPFRDWATFVAPAPGSSNE